MKPILCIMIPIHAQEVAGASFLSQLPELLPTLLSEVKISEVEESDTTKHVDVMMLTPQSVFSDGLSAAQLLGGGDMRRPIGAVLAQGLLGLAQVQTFPEMDFQRIISRIGVISLGTREDFYNFPPLHPLPKRRADWLIRRIGRTGGREASRSNHAHTQAAKRGKRSRSR